jgi:methylthioribose-1-phosphate isomerase
LVKHAAAVATHVIGHNCGLDQHGYDDDIAYVMVEGQLAKVLMSPVGNPAANNRFDVTSARLVTGLITERGICPASEEGILSLFPERAQAQE